nr:vitelline membrane outer layer protein 1-like [Chrysemys picta bellii]
MDSSLHATLGLLLGCCLWGAWGQTKIHVSNGGIWGTWGAEQSCPGNSFAVGFSLKVELPQLAGEDTALNGIRLLCSDSSTIQSKVGPWGWWGLVMKCPSGQRLTQFRLRVEPCRGLKDNMAAKNIEFVCTGGVKLRGDGLCRGKWGPQSRSCGPRGICTIATKVEAPQGKGDDTALNDVYFRCCRPETLTPTTTLPPTTTTQSPTSTQPPTSTTQSNVGPWGSWGPVKKGLSGQRLTQFRLREEPCRRLKDDTAANNIEFACTGGAELRGDGRS